MYLKKIPWGPVYFCGHEQSTTMLGVRENEIMMMVEKMENILSSCSFLSLVFFPKLAASFLGQMIARTLVSFARPNIFHAKQ